MEPGDNIVPLTPVTGGRVLFEVVTRLLALDREGELESCIVAFRTPESPETTYLVVGGVERCYYLLDLVKYGLLVKGPNGNDDEYEIEFDEED